MQATIIKTNFTCNNDCVFCLREKQENLLDKTVVLTDKVKKRTNNHAKIVFIGGEPALRPDYLGLIKSAKKNKYKKIILVSNGRIFAYSQFCQDVIKAGANEFHIMLAGYEAMQHDYLTSKSGSFAQTMKGIANLKRMRQDIAVICYVVKSNYRHLLNIVELLDKNKISKIHFRIVNDAVEKEYYAIIPRLSLAANEIKKCQKYCNNAHINLTVENMPLCLMGKQKKNDFKRNEADIYGCSPALEHTVTSKAKQCSSCIYNRQCLGVSSRYMQFYGSREIKPIK